MEKVINREQSRVKALIKAGAITFVVALCYYSITQLFPVVTFSSNVGPTAMGFRFANALRALALGSPFAAVGVGMGSMQVAFAGGKFGGHILVSLLSIVLGTTTYYMARQGKRSHAKNIALLLVYAVLMCSATNVMNLLKIAPVFLSVKFSTLFFATLPYKLVGEIVATLSGYPLYLILFGRK